DLLKPLKYRTLYIFKINTTSKIYKLTEILFTFILVDFAWIFFRATSFTNAKNLIKNMLFFNPYIFTSESIYKLGLDRKDFNVALLSILIVLFVDFIQYKTDICTSLIKK